MSLNTVTLQGRIPFDFEVKGAEGNEFTMLSISVARDFKGQDEKYYPEDLITCKAFKNTAKFLGQYFPKGSKIVVQGSLRRDDDYEKDGQQVKGQMFLLVEKAYFCDGGKSESTSGTGTPTPAKPAGKSPLAGGGAKPAGKSLNPLAGGAKKPTGNSPF